MKNSLENQLKNLNHSPASEPNPQWTASLRSKLEWITARGVTPDAKPLRLPRYMAWFRRPLAVASATLALLLMAGSGVAYAAQSALPGQILYPVKLASEEVRVAFTNDERKRTEIELQLANRRVEEFRVLSTSDQVTPETAAEISSRYEAHVSAALEALPHLPEETAATLADTLTRTVDAHLAITATIVQEHEKESETEPDTSLSDQIKEQITQRREEIKKQTERLREFARASSEAARFVKESKGMNMKYQLKVETDAGGRAHVKIETEQRRNGKKVKEEREFTVPLNAATTTLNIFHFDASEETQAKEKEDKKNSGARATSSIFVAPVPSTTIFNAPPFPASTTLNLRERFLRVFSPGTSFNIHTETSGSGSVEQYIETYIQSKSKIEIHSSGSEESESRNNSGKGHSEEEGD